MTHQSPTEMEAQLAALQEMNPDIVGDHAAKYVQLKNLSDACDTARKAAYNKLLEVMEEQGMEGCKAAGANITRKTIKSWGIAQGDSAEVLQANIEAARLWYNKVFPPAPIDKRPTVAMLKDAWEQVLAEDPNAVQPEFLIENEREQLSVRKAT